MGFPSVKLGLTPGSTGTFRLPMILGLSNSLKLLLYGDIWDSQKSFTLGLVDQHFENISNHQSFLQSVKNFSSKLVGVKRKGMIKKPLKYKMMNDNWIGRYFIYQYHQKQKLMKITKGKYPAPYYSLETAYYSFLETPSVTLDFESLTFGKMIVSPECKNLLSIHLLTEKAKNLPKELQNSETKNVKTVSIIGSGVIGSGITHLCACVDIKVQLRDEKEESIKSSMSYISSLSTKLIKKDIFTSYEMELKTKLIQFSRGIQNLSSDLVIESIVENLETKKSILNELEKNCTSGTIFATTTSSFSIDDLSKSLKNPENLVGIHFYKYPHKTNIVEIIKSKNTSNYALSTVYNFIVSLGKTPIIVNDSPGFILNRILFMYQCEACRILKEGGSVSEIDKIFENFGFENGPFRMLDALGLDVALQFGLNMKGERYIPFQELESLVSKGMNGKRSKSGFYTYTSKIKEVSSTSFHFISKNSKKIFAEDILDRCILLMVNEASHILYEKVVKTPEEMDLAIVAGIGFAPFRGGLLSYVDDRGIKNVISKLKLLSGTHGKRFEPCPLLETMAKENLKFFPNRPKLPYIERSGRPLVLFEGAIKARL